MNKLAAALFIVAAGSANAQLLTITADNSTGTITAAGDQALARLGIHAGPFHVRTPALPMSCGVDLRTPISACVMPTTTG